VVIQKLSFPASASAFNVYRGATPQTLYRIASAQTIGPVFIDTGLAPQPIGPPDASFDHANFYYRYQYAGPFPTTIHSANTVGWDSMGATSLVYAGKAVRIMEGKGRGQEPFHLNEQRDHADREPGLVDRARCDQHLRYHRVILEIRRRVVDQSGAI
jgi:hypothetical protein